MITFHFIKEAILFPSAVVVFISIQYFSFYGEKDVFCNNLAKSIDIKHIRSHLNSNIH